MPFHRSSYRPIPSDDDEALTESADIRAVPETQKARWSLIDDLDHFFKGLYKMHQSHGFTCMRLENSMTFITFAYIVTLTIFLCKCVDYSVLFHDDNHRFPSSGNCNHKITLRDAVIPIDECVNNFSGQLIAVIIAATIFWVLHVLKFAYEFNHYREVKEFYESALRIPERELVNTSWHEVQKRLLEVQHKLPLCIHKSALTEIDIYHRILRFKNYEVAMLNKSVLPVKLNLPIIGEVLFFTEGIKFNYEFILFNNPLSSPFEHSWQLRKEYKIANNRVFLAKKMSNCIFWIALVNLILSPMIFSWQILHMFYKYAEKIKSDIGSLTTNQWSVYARIYFRHFNELDHELNARLNRAYKPANKYMKLFTSPIQTAIASCIVSFTEPVLAILLVLSIYDEDVLQVEYVITIISVLTLIGLVCRGLAPDKNVVHSPETLLTSILAQVHYMPDHWKGKAHTTQVRDEFAQLFENKLVGLFKELLSPFICPFILYFYLRPKSLEIVDFLRNFTIDFHDTGDVCSFAQMNLRRHGHPKWADDKPDANQNRQAKDGKTDANKSHQVEDAQTDANENHQVEDGQIDANESHQAEDGKTELSLMHFSVTNPDWKPPPESAVFLTHLHEQQSSGNMLRSLGKEIPLPSLLEGCPLGSNIYRSTIHPCASTSTCEATAAIGSISQAEGPISGRRSLMFPSLNVMEQPQASTSQMKKVAPMESSVTFESAAEDMSFNALFVHQMHQKQLLAQRCANFQKQVQLPTPELPSIEEPVNNDR